MKVTHRGQFGGYYPSKRTGKPRDQNKTSGDQIRTPSIKLPSEITTSEKDKRNKKAHHLFGVKGGRNTKFPTTQHNHISFESLGYYSLLAPHPPSPLKKTDKSKKKSRTSSLCQNIQQRPRTQRVKEERKEKKKRWAKDKWRGRGLGISFLQGA